MRQVERVKAEAMHWPILEPIAADGQVNPIALSKPVCVAGDRGRVNLPLHSPQISRAHALFVTDADGVYLRDLASLNGVRVNDSPVREAVLHEGDVIGLGPFSFRCLKNFPQEPGAEQPHTEAAELRLTQNGARIPLTSRTLLIGSREECDIHISDDAVSPAHAVIFERDGRRFIRDLRTATGTQVNGGLVGEIELHPGDSIQIGGATIEYAPVSKPERSAAPEEPAAALEDSLIEPLVESPLDEVSLAADDSLIASSQAVAASEAVAPPQPAATAREDSAIIPLLDENAEESRPAPETPAAPTPVAPAPPVPAASSASHSEDSAVIPIEPEPEDAPVPDEPPHAIAADEAPHATADELLEGHESVPTPSLEGASENSRTFDVHPGTIDRKKAEAVFSELLDELADNVEQVQTVWQDLKTSPEEPGLPNPPGGGPTGGSAEKNPESPTRANSGSRKSSPNPD
jgi:pSer/pThr/pTyr-binding forkhead associated (FHA) protein